MIQNKPERLMFCRAQVAYDNLGDLIINKILLMNLRDYGTLVVDDTGVPEWFCEQLELKEQERVTRLKSPFLLSVLTAGFRSLFQPNLTIYFIPRPGQLTGGGFKKSTSMILTSIYYLLLDVLGVRVCRFGASVGPLSESMKLGERLRAKHTHFYSVRDSVSMKYVERLGISNARYFPDLAWFIEKQNETDDFSWLMKKPGSNLSLPSLEDESYIVFSFRASSHELYSDAQLETYRNRVFAFLDKIVDLVCIKLSKKLVISYQVERDIVFCTELQARYRNVCDTFLIEASIDCHTLHDLYSKAMMVFSNRLHVLLFALVSGSIPIAVIDKLEHDKITGIFLDAGLDRLIIDLHLENFETDQLTEIIQNSVSAKKSLYSIHDKNRELGKSLFKEVLS